MANRKYRHIHLKPASFRCPWRYFAIIQNSSQFWAFEILFFQWFFIRISVGLVYKWFLLYTHFLEIMWENLIGEARPELEKCRFWKSREEGQRSISTFSRNWHEPSISRNVETSHTSKSSTVVKKVNYFRFDFRSWKCDSLGVISRGTDRGIFIRQRIIFLVIWPIRNRLFEFITAKMNNLEYAWA